MDSRVSSFKARDITTCLSVVPRSSFPPLFFPPLRSLSLFSTSFNLSGSLSRSLPTVLPDGSCWTPARWPVFLHSPVPTVFLHLSYHSLHLPPVPCGGFLLVFLLLVASPRFWRIAAVRQRHCCAPHCPSHLSCPARHLLRLRRISSCEAAGAMPPAPAADEGGGGMMTIDSSSVVIAARSGAISPRQLAVVAGITSPSRSTDVDDLMPSLPDGALDLHALSPAVSDATSDDSTARPPAASAKPVAAVALSFSRVTLTRPSAGTLPSGSAGGVRGRAGAVARALPAVQAAQASVETRLQAVQRRQQQQQLRLAAWEKANLAVPRPDGTGCDAEALLAQARAFRQGERVRLFGEGGSVGWCTSRRKWR